MAETPAVTIFDLARKKARGEKISMLTAYDFPTACLVDDSGVDIALVGDSLGMEELGYQTTLPVTLEVMLHHTQAVRRGIARALLVADMPFLSYQINSDEAVRNAGRLLQEGGANAVKLEGGVPISATIRRLVDIGIPVMAHLGFTPQSVQQLGLRMQGKDEAGGQRIKDDARAVQDAGAFAVVLEVIPAELAAEITSMLSIPTIGIGAGSGCDGQVLVTSDLLGLRRRGTPYKHVRQYASIGDDILRTLRAYRADVEAGNFP